MATATVNGESISYTYNSDGIRTSKTVDGITTDYLVDGSTIVAQNTVYDTLWFMYDSDGTRVGFTYHDDAYYYMKNTQGDVTGIVDSNLNVVVEYSYDAWGKLIETTGSEADFIDKLNPFLYRGYYYDAETGLYYLGGRYYDPVTGRFLNADDTDILGSDQGNILQYNLYAYCMNNPINMVDHSGYIAEAIALSSSGFASFTAWLSTMGGTNFWNPVGWVILGILAAGVVTLAGIWLYNKYQAAKPKSPNLPSYKKLTLDKNHILSGHSAGGGRGGPNKDRFPDWMKWPMIQKAIEEAYNTSKKLQAQGDRVFLQGYSKTYERIVQMWVNLKNKVIETAWPK